MTAYWETHKKKFDGVRLSWYGDPADEGFWSLYWEQKLTQSFYEDLKKEKLESTKLGRVLLKELKFEQTILEAGCGAGSWVAILNNHGYKNVQGIDYSSDLTNHVNQINPKLNIRWGDIGNIQSADNSFDAYLSFGVIEHRLAGPGPYLHEAFRVLKPNGKAIITVPCIGPLRKIKARLGFYRDTVVGEPFFQYAFQKSELVTLLEMAGFQVQDAIYIKLDRMLMEEIFLFRVLAKYNSIRAIEKFFSLKFEGIDGHMVLIVAKKPG